MIVIINDDVNTTLSFPSAKKGLGDGLRGGEIGFYKSVAWSPWPCRS